MTCAARGDARRGLDHAAAVARDLDQCAALLAVHLDLAHRRLGGETLGVVDLPPLGEARVVPAQLQVAGVLLWCREVEATGLLELLEALVAAIVTGHLNVPLGRSGPALRRYWRTRHERFTLGERQALYRRVLGADFDRRFLALVGPLVELGRRRRDQGVADLHARISSAATELGAGLSARAVGISAFAAREIIAQIRLALDLLGGRELGLPLAGRGPWAALSSLGPRLLRRELSVQPHLARAEAGLAIVRWMASSGGELDGASPRRGAPIDAAERWLIHGGPG